MTVYYVIHLNMSIFKFMSLRLDILYGVCKVALNLGKLVLGPISLLNHINEHHPSNLEGGHSEAELQSFLASPPYKNCNFHCRDSWRNISALSLEDLDQLKSIKEISDYLMIQNLKNVTNFSFLSNLETILGRTPDS